MKTKIHRSISWPTDAIVEANMLSITRTDRVNPNNCVYDLGLLWCGTGGFYLYHPGSLNTLRPRQNRQHFADDTFKRNFLNENVWISINISLKFVPKVPINNILALVQIKAWRRPGDKPLSEPMLKWLPKYASLGLNELIGIGTI